MTANQYEPGPWVARPDRERIPVRSSARVDVKLRNGVYLRDILAGSLNWSQGDRHNDIMSWRLSRVARPSSKSPVVPHINIVVNIDDESAEALRQNWIEGVSALRARFREVTRNLRCSIQPSHRNSKAGEGAAEAPFYHGGGPINGKSRYLFGESPLGLSESDGAFIRTNLEKESAPEIPPESKAEVQSDLVRSAPQSEVDPDRAFERAYGEAYGHRLEKESAPETPIDPAAETQSDFEAMAEKITNAYHLHPTTNEAEIAKRKALLVNFLKRHFEAMRDKRTEHILKLWDQSQKIVLDGYSYRTKGVDHVARPELF